MISTFTEISIKIKHLAEHKIEPPLNSFLENESFKFTSNKMIPASELWVKKFQKRKAEKIKTFMTRVRKGGGSFLHFTYIK